jgi:hypothetical protein
MRLIPILACVAILSACASTYTSTPVVQPGLKLDPSKSVFIATPANGEYGSAVYANSGKMTANAVRVAFSRFTTNTTISPDCRDLVCLGKSQAQPYDYYVVPEILHWEDRATEWSGIPDRLEVKLSIFDGNKKELASTIITGKSKWATLGGDHPQDLLPEPLNKYVESLY